MLADGAFPVLADGIDDVDQSQNVNAQTRFFQGFAPGGLKNGFPKFLGPAGKAPLARSRRLSPLDQDEFVFSPYNDADSDDGFVRIQARHVLGLHGDHDRKCKTRILSHKWWSW